MNQVQELVAPLESTVADRTQLPAVVKQFQSTLFDSSSRDSHTSPQIEDTLRTLAHDLDFYVSGPDARAEDTSYYGEERALQEIEQALTKLRSLGAA